MTRHRTSRIAVPILALALAAGAAGCAERSHAEPAAGRVPTAAADRQRKEAAVEKATFAAGCFWGIESEFRALPGVVDARVGFTGGRTPNPSYEDVCTGRTGHAEAVEVIFDPAKIGYEQLLDAFWKMHDPTQVNRQGPDVGEQYRTAIFYQDDRQKELAEASKARLTASGQFRRPIATAIVAATTFYPAEEYHQRYLEKRGRARCHTR